MKNKDRLVLPPLELQRLELQLAIGKIIYRGVGKYWKKDLLDDSESYCEHPELFSFVVAGDILRKLHQLGYDLMKTREPEPESEHVECCSCLSRKK